MARSSILDVEMGSRAEVGSSISRTFGSTANALAIHSRIEDLAMELKKDYTIVIVTHNMQQAVRISDQTAFFLLGDLVEYGETEAMFSQPKDKRTEDYITGRFG